MPTATLPNGAVITLELAISPEERQQGLMFRPKLPVDRGMLFLFEREGMPGIWMKNTLIPLDLIYLDQQGRIVDIIEKVQPCKADPCPNYQATKPASAVLELAAGVVEEQGLRTGDRLAFAKVPGLPRVPSAG